MASKIRVLMYMVEKDHMPMKWDAYEKDFLKAKLQQKV